MSSPPPQPHCSFFLPFLPQPHFPGKSSSSARMQASSSFPKHFPFRAALNTATPGLVNPSQNPHCYLLGSQILELRVLLGSPVRLVPSRGLAGCRGSMCAGALPCPGSPSTRQPPRTHVYPPHPAVPSHSRKLPGSQTARQMLLGLAPTQAHTTPTAASCSVPGGAREVLGTRATPRQSSVGTCPTPAAPRAGGVPRVSSQWERDPDGNWGPRCWLVSGYHHRWLEKGRDAVGGTATCLLTAGSGKQPAEVVSPLPQPLLSSCTHGPQPATSTSAGTGSSELPTRCPRQ